VSTNLDAVRPALSVVRVLAVTVPAVTNRWGRTGQRLFRGQRLCSHGNARSSLCARCYA